MNLIKNNKIYNLELNAQEIKFVFDGLVAHACDYYPEGILDSKKQVILDKMIDQINMELEGKLYYS